MAPSSGTARARSITEVLAPIALAAEQLARLSGAGLRIGYPASLLIGLWVLRAYCISGGVPVPVPDASLLAYIAVLAAAYCLTTLWLAGGPFGVSVLIATTSEFRALRPAGSTWPPSRLDVFRFAKRWGLMFLPFLLSSSLPCLSWVLGVWLYPSWLGVNPVVLWGHSFLAVLTGASAVLALLGFVISIAVYEKRSERFFSAYARTASDVRTFAGASIIGVVVAWMWTLSMMFSVSVLILGTPLLEMNASVLNLLWIYGALVLWLAVAFFLVVWERSKIAFAFGVAVITLGMVLCAPRLGAITLRKLGYGGGLPISLVARVVEPGSTMAPVERINGCLVLRTGTEITILRPIDKQANLPHCHFNPFTRDVAGNHSIAVRMDTIRREDALDILFIGKRT